MASFTERYHTLTKYDPNTIDKLGSVHWHEQPTPFKPFPQSDKIPLKSLLEIKIHEETKVTEIDASIFESNLNLNKLTYLLYFTSGITSRIQTAAGDHFLRANPSAGALYPTEVYLTCKNIEGLADGLYLFHPLLCELHPLRTGNLTEKLQTAFCPTWKCDFSGVQILMTGLFSRSAWRYKERAYRRILLDTGHALGNLMTVCHESKLSAFLWAGFVDEKMEALFKLENKKETPLISIFISAESLQYPKNCLQPGSLPPAQAVKFVTQTDSIQIQQNTCERIHSAPEFLSPGITPEWNREVKMFPGNILPIIYNRRSCRAFSNDSLEFADLEKILQFAFGRFSTVSNMLSGDFLETHLIALKVEGLKSGIYRLGKSKPTEWQGFKAGDFTSEALNMSLGQELSASCAFLLVHTVQLSSLVEKFGDRGYRYICMDAGLIGQRINLICESMNLGSSGIGGYFDDSVNEVIGLPLTQAVIYLTTVGVPEIQDF